MNNSRFLLTKKIKNFELKYFVLLKPALYFFATDGYKTLKKWLFVM